MLNRSSADEIKVWPLRWILACLLFVPVGIGGGVFLADQQIRQNAAEARAGVDLKKIVEGVKSGDDGNDQHDDKDGKRKPKRKRASGRYGRFVEATRDLIEAIDKANLKESKKK